MSDTGNDATAQAASTAPTFTEREMQMLAYAMMSLKTGMPDVDYDKLAEYAGMSNPRSASNAWAKIKAKLLSATASGTVTVPPTTPKKGGAKKKAPAKSGGADADGADGESPVKKTPRKRPAKQDVDGEESTPKKKGRPAKAKKASDDETAQTKTPVKKEIKTEVKAETDVEPDAGTDDEI